MTAVDAWRCGFQGRPLPSDAGPELVRAWHIGRARALALPLDLGPRQSDAE